MDVITLHTYAHDAALDAFRPLAELDNIDIKAVPSDAVIGFDYVHCLSTPYIAPRDARKPNQQTLAASDEVVLRFGMMEGTARVVAERCVYDPQSAFEPELFGANGSRAEALAIVANRGEVIAMGGDNDPLSSARRLIKLGAEVVVIKSGPKGAQVVTADNEAWVPANLSHRVWTIGSGDVFAAMFAARWGVHRDSPLDAARIASLSVANYAETMALPTPAVEVLLKRESPISAVPGLVYLASPFFSLGQRWLVDEARRALMDLGMSVFSPVHDVGPGDASVVAPADLQGLNRSDVVFAILDGLDSGTLFEVGYARAINKPVYALAQTVSVEDMKMIEGSGCRVFDDFVTAIHHSVWRA